jgi:phage-related protein
MSKPVSSNATVFRAIGYKRWIKDYEVAPDAFFLRMAETTLSVLTQADCSKEICFAGLGTCFGEIEMKAESIRQLGLEIIDDSKELEIPHHASIINLPPHEGDTFAEAEFIAGKLAKLENNQIRERPKS